jgi:hypothetical protein
MMIGEEKPKTGVPERASHIAMMWEHAGRHQRECDGVRLRMLYDARILGALWIEPLLCPLFGRVPS